MGLYDTIKALFEDESFGEDVVQSDGGLAEDFFNSEPCWRDEGGEVDKEYANLFDTKGIYVRKEAGFGGEGKGDDYWTVYKFTGHGETVYVKFFGSYASFDGAYYEGFRQVQPQQKTITVYK